ncbi:MAG TPA: hypothetical protein VGL55_14675 [Steroidobacteraceae bacterium]|jgi:hypothetical protein
MIHENILRFRRARYAWWALALVALSAMIYATQGGRERPGGGTWQGYVLGTIGALLILWLTLLGIRKRSYRATLGSVQGWTSAHVWLGLALVLIATLHCAGLFGWNVHTLAYVLMCLVIASGIFGLYVYLSMPRQLAANSGGLSRAALFAELFGLDRQGRELARACDPAVGNAVRSSIERTSLGGGVLRQLLGLDRSLFMRGDPEVTSGGASLAGNTDQRAVIDYVAVRVPQAAKRAEAGNLQALIVLLSRRQAVLRRIRRDIQLQAWLQLWLYVHVPLTVALIVALVVHILTTFMYW